MPSATDMPSVPASAVRRALRHRAEVGLLDVRPEGHFAAGHPLFAASLPLGRLEAEVFDRLPGRRAPLAVVDTSRQFQAGHLPGAAWALRTDLAAEPAFSTQPASALRSYLASALPSQPASTLAGVPDST